MGSKEDKNLPAKPGAEDPARALSLAGIQLDAYRVYRGQEEHPHAEPAPAKEFSFRDLLYTVFRHKFKIAFLFLACTLGAASFVSRIPDAYQSEARVMIRNTRQRLIVNSEGAAGQEGLVTSGGGGGGDAEVFAEQGILSSEAIATAVVDRLGPEKILYSPEYAQWLRTPEGQASLTAEPPPPTGVFEKSLDFLGGIRQAVVDRLRLEPEPLSNREYAISAVQNGLESAPTRGGSNILRITYQSHTPEVAQEVLSAILEEYVTRHIEVHKAQLDSEFLQSEADKLKGELSSKEAEIEKLQKELNITSLENERTLKLEELSSIETQRRAAQVSIVATSARLGKIEELIKKRENGADGGEEIEIADPQTERIIGQIADLQLELAELLTRYKDNTPPVEQKKSQIKNLEKMLEDAPKATKKTRFTADPVRLKLEEDRRTYEAELEAQQVLDKKLGEEADKLRGEIAGMGNYAQHLTNLQRERDLLDQKYRNYMNSLATVLMNDTLDKDRIGNVRVVQPASMPMWSVRSQKKVMAILGFGLGMGLVAGLGAAFAMDFFNHSLRTSEDVERSLGLPVLVVLPKGRLHRAEPKEEAA